MRSFLRKMCYRRFSIKVFHMDTNRLLAQSIEFPERNLIPPKVKHSLTDMMPCTFVHFSAGPRHFFGLPCKYHDEQMMLDESVKKSVNIYAESVITKGKVVEGKFCMVRFPRKQLILGLMFIPEKSSVVISAGKETNSGYLNQWSEIYDFLH